MDSEPQWRLCNQELQISTHVCFNYKHVIAASSSRRYDAAIFRSCRSDGAICRDGAVLSLKDAILLIHNRSIGK
jgi:hypothetical protein